MAQPELVLGFVAPAGSDYDRVIPTVTALLHDRGYQPSVIRLSDILGARARRGGRLAEGAAAVRDRRTGILQDEGNQLRARTEKPHALALVTISEIRASRGEDGNLLEGRAHLVWSLKRPEEVAVLRAVYRERFFLVSIHSPRDQRVENLAARIARDDGVIGDPRAEHRGRAEELIERDEAETGAGDYGQNVRDTFPLADFFVNASSDEQLQSSLARCVDIITGDPFATPTKAEYAMFVAHAAALRSAELGRQVGAAIASRDGDILATGTNEVPAPGGGHYWHGDANDAREFLRTNDTSDELRHQIAEQIVREIHDADGGDLEAQRRRVRAVLDATRLRDITEFGRAVHAELSALLDAARRGIAVAGHDMYVTTFPCHQCARHVVGAGIQRLTYVYPYTKSLALYLHKDAIQSSAVAEVDNVRVPFVPFVGVAPRRYQQAFMAPRQRKLDSGEVVSSEPSTWTPRWTEEDPEQLWESGSYIVREEQAVATGDDVIAELSSIEDEEDPGNGAT